MKKILYVISIMFISVILTGCFENTNVDKVALTAGEFETKMVAKKYEVIHEAIVFNDPVGIVLSYSGNKNGHTVTFKTFDTAENAKAFFNYEVMPKIDSNGDKYSKTTSHYGNWSAFTWDTLNIHRRVTVIDKTILYFYGTSDDKNIEKDMFSYLGY